MTKVKEENKFLDVLKKLPENQQELIFKNGLFLKIQELENKIDLANQKITKFKNKYKCNLSQLETKGLPNNASFNLHEEYIEWKYWDNVFKESNKLLNLLRPLVK